MTRLPGVDALLAGVTPFKPEYCVECNGDQTYECCRSPDQAPSFLDVASNTRPRARSLQAEPTKTNVQASRWRAQTFNASYPSTPVPLLRQSVNWTSPNHSPANSFTSSSLAPSTPSTPASSGSPLPPQFEVWTPERYGIETAFPSRGASPASPRASTAEEDDETASLVDDESGDCTPVGGPGAPVFAVFRPVEHGKSLAMAASGRTLAALHQDWKARLPPDTAPTEEEIRRKPLPCPYCRRRFDRPSIRKTHMNSHTGERPFKCSFSGCDRTFSVLSNKYRHERSHKTKVAAKK
ncbi:hypothetical protein AURDEDRAFT_154505 [Auricularia subglabra TFB-10046 SS5]|nr:hypothetical protein AURDEDRAFT_154505 [Auricularia subglabra TFB-10046 SS5]